jgi:hypothetical protein
VSSAQPAVGLGEFGELGVVDRVTTASHRNLAGVGPNRRLRCETEVSQTE